RAGPWVSAPARSRGRPLAPGAWRSSGRPRIRPRRRRDRSAGPDRCGPLLASISVPRGHLMQAAQRLLPIAGRDPSMELFQFAVEPLAFQAVPPDPEDLLVSGGPELLGVGNELLPEALPGPQSGHLHLHVPPRL